MAVSDLKAVSLTPDIAPMPSRSGLKKSPSFAQCDIEVYRKAFNASDHHKQGSINAVDVQHVAKRLGYRISDTQLSVCISFVLNNSQKVYILFVDVYISTLCYFTQLSVLSNIERDWMAMV